VFFKVDRTNSSCVGAITTVIFPAMKYLRARGISFHEAIAGGRDTRCSAARHVCMDTSELLIGNLIITSGACARVSRSALLWILAHAANKRTSSVANFGENYLGRLVFQRLAPQTKSVAVTFV